MYDTPALSADRIARNPWFLTEKREPRLTALDRAWRTAGGMLKARGSERRGAACKAVVRAVAAAEAEVAALDDGALMEAARTWGSAAGRGEPASLAHAGPLFALIREAAGRTLGMRHYNVQLMGGLALMRGQLAEMQTGEGKTLTATLAASAMALTGRPVHVVTVNDYLAVRDAEEMGPVYRALGLTIGLVTQGMSPEARLRAYAADVTYCTNKELAFDYLKDRLQTTASGPMSARARLAHTMARDGTISGGLMRGLAFALIDEADSVLIDEARTPLILSGEGPALFSPELLEAARDATDILKPGDYQVDTAERRIELLRSGLRKLDRYATGGLLANRVIRDELVIKALNARHLFRRDEHYLVRDGKVQIIDEYTGRIMPDRFWSDGLHQMVELKEGVELSRGRVTLARTTYQRFFRRYDRISGMSGTAREVAGELWSTYELAVATIPTHRPVQRWMNQAVVLGHAKAKWARIARDVSVLNSNRVPVLVGTRSVAASQEASAALTEAGVPHTVLSAEQDAEEAEIIAAAGQEGRVTVATNMAGRGADIKLGVGVADMGGLHVLMSESHDSTRIDRQLAGRAGRQGDPGWFRPYLSLEDALIAEGRAWHLRMLARLPFGAGIRRWALRRAQAKAERLHARMRRDLMRQDEVLTDAMAFVGTPD